LQSRTVAYSAASFAPVPAESMVGEWQGIYYAYPEPMGQPAAMEALFDALAVQWRQR
jgi:hypothetical protein